MTWARLDDGFGDHPKFAALSNDATALWVRALAYCTRYLTDGLVPFAMVAPLARTKRPQAVADELLRAKLWEACDDGYKVHDFAKYNPTKATVEAQRASAAERQSRHRNTLRNAVTGAFETALLTPLVTPIPSRPVPDLQTPNPTEWGTNSDPPDPAERPSGVRMNPRAHGTNPRAIAAAKARCEAESYVAPAPPPNEALEKFAAANGFDWPTESSNGDAVAPKADPARLAAVIQTATAKGTK